MRINLTDPIMDGFGLEVTSLCDPDDNKEFLVMSARTHDRDSMSICICLGDTEYEADKLSVYAQEKKNKHLRRLEYISKQNVAKRGISFEEEEIRLYSGVLTQTEVWDKITKITPVMDRVVEKTPCAVMVGGEIVEFLTEGFVVATELLENGAINAEVCRISKFPVEEIPEEPITKSVYDTVVNKMLEIDESKKLDTSKIEHAMKIVNFEEKVLFTI